MILSSSSNGYSTQRILQQKVYLFSDCEVAVQPSHSSVYHTFGYSARSTSAKQLLTLCNLLIQLSKDLPYSPSRLNRINKKKGGMTNASPKPHMTACLNKDNC